MERYTKFVGSWKTEHSKEVNSFQIDTQIKQFPTKISGRIFEI